jgi:hypothetical protein
MLNYIYTANACDILKVLPDRVHHLQSGWMCHFLEVKHQCWVFLYTSVSSTGCALSQVEWKKWHHWMVVETSSF